MLALTPSPSNTLAEVEARLGRPLLDRLMAAPRSKPESPSPPAFHFRAIVYLNPVLSPMGMAAFFAGNVAQQGVAISANETGIEATVATGADAADNLETLEALDDLDNPVPAQPLVPSLSRPFLFLIRETRTGLILFIGRVAEMIQFDEPSLCSVPTVVLAPPKNDETLSHSATLFHTCAKCGKVL